MSFWNETHYLQEHYKILWKKYIPHMGTCKHNNTAEALIITGKIYHQIHNRGSWLQTNNQVEEYIKNPKDVFDKDIVKNKNLKHIQFRFDLHGYTLLEANKKVKNIINECSEKNYKEILLITGKGLHSHTEKDTYVSKNLSKLKYSIPEYINSDEELK